MTTTVADRYIQKQKRNRLLGLAGFGLLALTVLISIGLGRADLSIDMVWKIIVHNVINGPDVAGSAGLPQGVEVYQNAIVWDVRLPRVLTALAVGAGLAVSGAIFQSILRNPLADPFTVGVSTGAAFGAVLAIYMNLFIVAFPLPITPFAFGGALLALLVVMRVARVKGVIRSSNLIIAGIIVSSILSAGISFMKSAAGEEVAAIVYWLMGSMAARSWDHVALAVPLVFLGIGLAGYHAKSLDIMSLGEREAVALGVDVKKTMNLYLITASLLTAICVSVSGIIGFVGLIIPHMIRMGISSENRVLIPLSAIFGALLLVVADNFSRLLFAVELPVGVITTLLGGPFFIWLFGKARK